MLYNQKRLDELLDKMGMRYEASRLLEAGATYEMIAEALHDMIDMRINPRQHDILKQRMKIPRMKELFQKYNGIGTDKEYTLKDLGTEYNISSDRVRQINNKVNWRYLFFDFERESIVWRGVTRDDKTTRSLIRSRRARTAKTRKEIYERVMEKLMEQPPKQVS